MAKSTTVDLPLDLWDQIISMIDDDRHLIESLSLVSKQFFSISNRHNHTLNISNPTLHFLPSLLRRFPNLKHLSLSDFSGDPYPVLLQIADFNFRLETLNLSNQTFFPGEALKRFPPSMLNGVKSLNLSWFSHLDDDDLDMIPTFFPRLEELDLSQPHGSAYYVDDNDFLGGYRLQRNVKRSGSRANDRVVPTRDGIYLLSSKLNCLRRIDLQGWKDLMSDELLISISDNCPYLEEIVFKDSKHVTEDGIGFALVTCQKLKSIGLCGHSSDNRWLPSAYNFICDPLCCALNLSKIHLCNFSVTDSILYAIAKARLPGLKSFTVSHCTYYEYEGMMMSRFTSSGLFSFVQAYQSLGYLSLEGGYHLSDESMVDIAKYLINVTVVKLNRCEDLTESTLFTLMEQCPLLESVEMKRTNIGRGNQGGDSDELSCQNIKSLNLSFNNKLYDKQLMKIVLACPKLETLKLGSNHGISKKSVGGVLRNCGHLKLLQIDGCPQVKKLNMGFNINKLEFLIAPRSGLEDEALINISKRCPNLMCLNVEDCTALTSKGVIQVVDKCTKLKEINLHGCENVSSCIVPWMVSCNPNLRIIAPPNLVNNNDNNMYLRHGCYVKK